MNMNGTLKELMEEVWTTENEKNKKEPVGNAKFIRIHPSWFNKVAASDNAERYLEVDYNVQAHRLCGYPLIITLDVEKWTIDFEWPKGYGSTE